MSFQIRFATAADCDIILNFIKGIAEYEKLSHEVEATVEKIATHLFGPKAVAECLLAHEGNTPIGFALFFHNYSTFVSKPGIYLEDLFVDPNFRGKGYGKALLETLIQLAKDRDCGRIEWSVLDWNTSAISFYQSMGAKPMNGWTVFRISL